LGRPGAGNEELFRRIGTLCQEHPAWATAASLYVTGGLRPAIERKFAQIKCYDASARARHWWLVKLIVWCFPTAIVVKHGRLVALIWELAGGLTMP